MRQPGYGVLVEYPGIETWDAPTSRSSRWRFAWLMADRFTSAIPTLSESRRAVVIQEDESLVWLEPLLIVSIDWPGGKPKRGGNGSTKKRPGS